MAGEETERNTWIPLKELPEDCRRIVNAWNRLHLKTFYGLYPTLLEKVQCLLQKYGVETVIRGIALVADSSFLLGRSKYKGFKVTFCWLLDPDHFARMLSGKYEDQPEKMICSSRATAGSSSVWMKSQCEKRKTLLRTAGL